MMKKILVLIFLTSFSFLLLSPLCFHRASGGRSLAVQGNGLRVHNADTGLSYSTIQEAINAPETMDGHTIAVAPGIFHENVVVNKTLSLLGEDRSTTIIDGNGTGIVVYITADNVVFTNFTVQNGAYGIRLYYSENSKVDGNNINNNEWFGVELKYSGNNTLRNNSLVGNQYNFGVDGASLADFLNDIDTSNTVNGKPIYYLINQRNLVIDAFTFPEIGYLALVNSTNIKVKDLDLTLNKEGLLFAFVSNSTIGNVSAVSNFNGIYVKLSFNVTVGGSNANNNFDYAIALRSSENSTVSQNSVNNNTWGGISLGATLNSKVIGNNVTNNHYGIHLVESDNNIISKNSANNKNGGYSIVLYRSNSNVIYHNNFVNSFIDTYKKSISTWDNDLEGNYWSSYTGIDADQNGIADTPYVLDKYNKDNYPLAGNFSEFNVTWQEQIYGITVISNSTMSQFQFTPADGTISFNAAGEAQTVGFCRIAVLYAIVQGLQRSNLTVLVNGQPPITQKSWTDDARTYLYLTYIHAASSTSAIPALLAAVALILVVALAFVIIIKRQYTCRIGKLRTPFVSAHMI